MIPEKLAGALKFEIKILSVLSLHTEYSTFHWEFQCNHMNFENILEILLNRQQANVFNLQHLQGASSDLVRSMFQVGCKAAELERTKLQTEIQKEKREIRRKQLEN